MSNDTDHPDAFIDTGDAGPDEPEPMVRLTITELDGLHAAVGLRDEWLASERRAEMLARGEVVR